MADQYLTTPPGQWNKRDFDNLVSQINFMLKNLYTNVGNIQETITNFDSLQLAGSTVTYATSSPSKGTWTRGSIVFNSLPTSGLPMMWVCTSSGTPGTWEGRIGG